MAIQKGAIQYTGSFKSIRNYRVRHDKRIIAGEKGGANGDLIKNNPAFVNTRLSENEFGGCARAVKGIRKGFVKLLPEMVDAMFTSRLMQMTRKISVLEKEGNIGKRPILFSKSRNFIRAIQFNKEVRTIETCTRFLRVSHSDSRAEASLKVENLTLQGAKFSRAAERYRLISHLSIVSDYFYSEETRQYEPTNQLDNQCAYAYSDYMDPYTELNTEIKVSFPEGTVIGDDCSVIHCVGIEFYVWNGSSGYQPTIGQSLQMMNVY
jgi:hypothetical protein